MKTYFAYTRVSTVRQGERGVSLPEQREAIERHAQRSNLKIIRWFEERETAAKRGRPVFSEMISRLQAGQASGVIIHKIDRSARNLRDWADLGDLIDQNIDVHFANEALDLQTRGGRLTADIQAVVASDYIRNLREETKKGFYGRLKQGILPMPAPVGYLDVGPGKPKAVDPDKAALVRVAFSLYTTRRYSLKQLRKEMHARGLRSKSGKSISVQGIARILRNPFYTGIIRIRLTGDQFKGAHEPIVSMDTFKQETKGTA